MRSTGWALLLVVATGCASSGPAPGPTSPPPVDATPPVVEDRPAPTPLPTPVPTGPIPTAPDVVLPDRPIRVLLRRTSRDVRLPQPGRAYLAETGGRTSWIFGPLTVESAAETAWQVGAWRDPSTAAAVAAGLRRRFGDELDVWREPAAGGLERVRVRWPAGAPDDAQRRLADAGFAGALPVAAGGAVRIIGTAKTVLSGGEIVLTPAGQWPTAVEGRRYRGRFRLRAVGGELLLINELGIEDYLRGVVPVEMGPYQFPELEALKAQAVAARTYAVAHLGDHDDEGWDICATPACQAYHGAGAEHALSDRAVSETAGIIAVWHGAPIDAMYTSTCGGHTEDAGALFADRVQPYLTGVACAWDRPLVIAGADPPPAVSDRASLRRLLARAVLGLEGAGGDPVAAIPRVAERCGGVAPPLPAEPSLAEWVEALSQAAGLDEHSPLVSGEGAGRLVRLADLFGIPLSPIGGEDWRAEWYLEAAAAVLELRGVIRHDTGEAVPHPDGVAIYPRRADRSELLPQPVPLVWRWGDRFGGASAVRVLPGSTVERYRVDDEIVALVVVQSGGGGDADRRSAWSSWRREKSWAELAAGLGEAGLRGIEIVDRGRSGRVVSLAVIGADGRRRLVRGFEIRRALDLPETLFEMHVTTDAAGGRKVQFLGRGWGHGVGLCQNGAYGLARAGMTFDRILKHYYTGIELAGLAPSGVAD